MKKSETVFTISAVEREVGVSKDVLRVWERRYGFPVPVRDARGDRLYSQDQVSRLRLVKRLMDAGHRPGKLLSRPLGELQRMGAEPPALPARSQDPDAAPTVERELLALLAGHAAEPLARALQKQVAQQGLANFVQDTVAPLAHQVGQEWARGRLQVYEEHLFTEAAVRVLRQAIAAVPVGTGPVVLLTTLPEEPHGLGLLMVESLLVLEGARCVNLGTQLPLLDISRAAQAYAAGIVALSFSAAFPARRIPELLRQLRSALAPGIQLWAGGAAMRRVADVEGVKRLTSLGDARAELAFAAAAAS